MKVSGTAALIGPVPFSTPLAQKIVNTPHYEKVKMPIMDLYDGTTDLEEH